MLLPPAPGLADERPAPDESAIGDEVGVTGTMEGGAGPAASGAAVNVSTPAELVAAINNASAGTTIVLADGTYADTAFSVRGKSGTEASPITIQAAHQGRAVLTGSSSFTVDSSSYVTIQGLRFAQSSSAISAAVKLNNADHVRLTRNTFALTQDQNPNGNKWVVIQGSRSHHNRIDHNEFGPRQDLGQMIAFQGSVMSQYDVIEYNYFHDAAQQTANGGETIRVGLSGSSMTDGFATIQYNLFVNCDSDAEIVSVKSGHNTVRYNTFINNRGQVTSRHGHGNSFYGNFFFGDGVKSGVGGLRIYANDHKIYNNYFENLTGATLEIDGGDFDGGPDGANYTSGDLAKHWRVYRAQVTNNTIVNSRTGIVIGKSYTYAPVDSRVANNIVYNSTGILYNEVKATNTVFEGNIGYGAALDNVPRAVSEINGVDPRFTMVDGLQKLSFASPAIDAAAGSYPFVIDDMEGQPRSANDVGADEFSAMPAARGPLTPADVGPSAMTAAQVQGTGYNGWYTSDVSVTLSVPDPDYGNGQTEYRLDQQAEWQPYGAPIRLSAEGRHTLYYRSTDAAGNVEEERTLPIRIDKQPPAFSLLADGTPITGTSVFDDTRTITLQLQAEDGLSGLALRQFTVTGATYESQAVVNLSGLAGEQQVVVKLMDVAGNKREQTVSFRVAPTIATLSGLVDRYAAQGALNAPLEPQLRNSADQARHQYDKGSVEQAVKHLDDFVKHLQNESMQRYIAPDARQALESYVGALIDWWSSQS